MDTENTATTLYANKQASLVRLKGYTFDILCMLDPEDLDKKGQRIELHAPTLIKVIGADKDKGTYEIDFIPFLPPLTNKEQKSIRPFADDVLYDYRVNESLDAEFRSHLTGVHLPKSSLVIPEGLVGQPSIPSNRQQ